MQEMTVTDILRRRRRQDFVSRQTLRLEDIGQPLAVALAGHHRHAVLIADAAGLIRFASTRQLFGWSDQELPGTHLQWLIPTLPVRENTPGYNVAYVRMAFATQDWQPQSAAAADGDEVPVEVSVRILPIGRSYALLIAIRELPARRSDLGLRALAIRGDEVRAA
jgi:hypothetical protein